MWSFDFPWWFVALAYLYAFAPWVCLGATTGFVLAYVPLSASARRGGRGVPGGKLTRVGLCLLAALTGGATTFLLALSANNGGY